MMDSLSHFPETSASDYPRVSSFILMIKIEAQ